MKRVGIHSELGGQTRGKREDSWKHVRKSPRRGEFRSQQMADVCVRKSLLWMNLMPCEAARRASDSTFRLWWKEQQQRGCSLSSGWRDEGLLAAQVHIHSKPAARNTSTTGIGFSSAQFGWHAGENISIVCSSPGVWCVRMQRHHTPELHSGRGSVKTCRGGKDASGKTATPAFPLLPSLGLKLGVSMGCKEEENQSLTVI